MRRKLLAAVGFVFIAFALFQFALAFRSPEASRYLGAPRWALAIVESGGPKLWLLAFLAVGGSVFMGVYALSGAGLVRRLPRLRLILFLLGSALALWGLGFFELVARNIKQPGSVAPRFFVIRGVPLLLGLICVIGASAVSARPACKVRAEAEPAGAANGSQPIRSETNRTSPAAGSRR